MEIPVERHPLEPFLPEEARLLMLGSFPPARKRWSMDFFYPNLQNDMWRIFGYIFFDNKEHFLVEGKKRFDRELLIEFLTEKGVALYDTAVAVRRLKDNASDKFLEIVEPTDLHRLLQQIPHCKGIVTTGEKAVTTLSSYFGIDAKIGMGEKFTFDYADRELTLYRMPSSSRAYPLSIEKKAMYYRTVFQELGLL